VNLTIALESRFTRTPDGAVWSTGWLDAGFWARYFQCFDAIRVLARVREAHSPPAGAKRADTNGVAFAPLPYYVGPWQYVRRYAALTRAVAGNLESDDAVLLRVPGAIGSLVARHARHMHRPFGVEVVGDPDEVFRTGVNSRLAPLFRISAARGLRRQCRAACAVSYVSRHPLAKRYPPGSDAFVTVYSSIDLRDEAFKPEPRRFTAPPKPLRIISVGSMEQMYKGYDLLIKAVATGGPTWKLTLVGDGRHRRDLEALARAEGTGDRVRFTGTLPPGEPVRTALDNADLFVLPSRTEGLPRALIEAMARGLPCLGTAVGGIPELLEESELLEPERVDALAGGIAALAGDPARLTALSAQNIDVARRYHADVLQPKRRAFYQILAERTRAWLNTHASGPSSTIA